MHIISHYNPIIILIPAKNEARTVGNVIAEVKACFGSSVTLLIIDDASTDNTAEVARVAGAKVLSLTFSLGAWGAIQTGLRYADERGFKIAITMDADGQHEADSIIALLSPLVAGQCDVAIGACPQRGSFARRLAWSFFRRLSGITLEDLTSGLRAYNRTAITLLAAKSATLLDYQDMGVLILLSKAGLRIQEVPVFMLPRLNGHSRIFNSWWAVSRYLLQTTILCLAQVQQGR
jgi:hypothetical protein